VGFINLWFVVHDLYHGLLLGKHYNLLVRDISTYWIINRGRFVTAFFVWYSKICRKSLHSKKFQLWIFLYGMSIMILIETHQYFFLRQKNSFYSIQIKRKIMMTYFFFSIKVLKIQVSFKCWYNIKFNIKFREMTKQQSESIFIYYLIN
jgi:hypothetical protein